MPDSVARVRVLKLCFPVNQTTNRGMDLFFQSVESSGKISITQFIWI